MSNLSPRPKSYITALADSGIEIAASNTSDALGITTVTSDGNTTDLLTKLPIAVTPTGASRSLNSAFRPSTANPCLVFYTIDLSVTFSLLSNDTVTVDLLSDTANPPTTSQGQAKLSGNQTLGLAVTTNNTARQQIVAYIPAGNYVELSTSGTGNATLVSALELEYTP